MLRNAQKCAELRRNAQNCAEMRISAQKYAEMHRNAQKCAEIHRNAQKCIENAEMHRNAQQCTEIRRNAQSFLEIFLNFVILLGTCANVMDSFFSAFGARFGGSRGDRGLLGKISQPLVSVPDRAHTFLK